MWARPIASFSFSAYADATPVLGRQGRWKISGACPEFELQIIRKSFRTGWAVLSFKLSTEGAKASNCVLSVYTATGTQRFGFANDSHVSTVVRVSPDVTSVRILLNTRAEAVSISPVSMRLIGKPEAAVRLLAGLVRARGLRQAVTDLRTAVKLLRSDGSPAVTGWIFERNMLSSADDAPWSLIPTKVDLFDDMDVACALGLDRRHFLWVPQQADAVDDLWSAARYCIDLLRTRADLRQRFPDALSAGASGAFAQWLAAEGGNLLNLSSDARDSIGRALGADLSNHIRQLYLARDDLRAFFPLALTPAGRREFFRWVLRDGRELPGVRLETIWWFFLECAENPSAELTRTYLFTPKWQSLFPDGLTVFGRAKFAAWLAEHYGLDADWAKPSCWPLIGTPAENIRLAYALREDWHGEQPGAFESQESARKPSWLAEFTRIGANRGPFGLVQDHRYADRRQRISRQRRQYTRAFLLSLGVAEIRRIDR